MIDLLWLPLLASLLIASIHVYLGIHIVERGVIFVDLALAQIAVLGSIAALAMGVAEGSFLAWLISFSFVIAGALLFALIRPGRSRIPKEAVIGVCFVVASALAVLLLDGLPHGQEELKHTLTGNILFVDPGYVKTMAIVYVALGLLHYIFRRQFLALAFAKKDAVKETMLHPGFWDFLFYLSFGAVVSVSVESAGVLLVFSYLVVPTLIGMLFVVTVRSRLLLGWAVALTASLLGMTVSVQADLPTGSSIVACFGLLLALAGMGSVVCLRPKQEEES